MLSTPRRPETPLSSTRRADVAGGGHLDRALESLGDRWSLAIVAQLTAGPARFNDLIERVAPIARTVLSDRLRRLEDLGVIARRQYSDAPPRSNYRLTASGGELARVCAVFADWSSRRLGDGSPALVHADCGGAVLTGYTCELCGPVAARDVTAASQSSDRNVV